MFGLLCSVQTDTCIVRLALYFFINGLKGIVLLMYSHFLSFDIAVLDFLKNLNAFLTPTTAD